MKRMKYVTTVVLLCLVLVMITPSLAFANNTQNSERIGDMGFFGGISEGRRLPRTTETILRQQANNNNRNNRRGNTVTLNYRELVFLDGEPIEFEGLIDITKGMVDPDSTAGTFDVRYVVRPPAGVEADVAISRTLDFVVQYRVVGNQVIYYYQVNRSTWSEVITLPSGIYTLDTQRSSYTITIIEYRAPAVSYYRGNINARLFFTDDDAGEEDEAGRTVVVEKFGEFYGFSSAWSSTETHRMNVTVTDNMGFAMSYQIRPSIAVNKVLQYTANEVFIMGFPGNYQEVLQSFAGLRFDIFTAPQHLWYMPTSGGISLETVNTFEQLPSIDVSFLRGNAAEDDIHRLFAMQILQGDPIFFVPEQAITRGQFMTALARAIKLPIEEVVLPRQARGRDPVVINIFRDVDTNRPEFSYIQALQRAGIAHGRADGNFYFDYPIQRQEAFAIMIRALGLTNLALNPTVAVPFTDSDLIHDWAMREMSVAHMIGLIIGDANGNIDPLRPITKGEAAELFNRLLEFMRVGLVSEYSEQIVNIVR
jgi:hypothetical protein